MSEPMTEFQTPNVTFERERGVYAIHITRDIAHTIISMTEDAGRGPLIGKALRILADAKIAIFLVKLHRSSVTLAMAGTDAPQAETELRAMGFQIKTRRDVALLVVRATSMRDLFGVMVEIADSLSAANAHLFETGDSHNSVQCLIEDERAADAAAALCRTFALDPKTAVREVSIEAEDAA